MPRCALALLMYPKVKEGQLRFVRVCALAGAQIPEEFMVSRLTRLGCKVTLQATVN